MPFAMPPHVRTRDGAMRHVGVELEYQGVPPEVVAQALVERFGGRVEVVNRFHRFVRATRLGDFGIELDYATLRDAPYVEFLESIGIQRDDVPLLDKVEALAEQVASTIAPYEVVSPPVPLDELDALEEVRALLHAHRAEGTRASFRYAFGLHFNVEAPALDGPTLLAYLKSFLVLYDWLVVTSNIDLTRRVFPFIEPFPEAYRRQVVAPDYRPDLDGLIADYLAANPTRNRPLDMVPMFTELRGEVVSGAIKETELVRPRPAFHYRLPNCLIDEPEWTLAGEWSRWIEVERLAGDPARLDEMGEAFLQLDVPLHRRAATVWAEACAARLARVDR
jgi:hypothetical protein